MKKCWMVLPVLLAGTAGAEDLVIRSFETDGTITFNAISNATEYQVDQEIDGVWTNPVSISATGSDTITASVSRVDQSALFCAEATVSNSTPPGFSLVPAGTCQLGSPTNELGRDADEPQH